MNLKFILPILFFTNLAAAQAIIPMAIWGNKMSKLKFTTTAQTVSIGNCSGTATVQTVSSAGAAINQTSNLTVNLATTGSMTFYSDASCSASVTSIVVASGTNSKDFYFIMPSVATETVTVTATGLLQTTQVETGMTNAYVWTGGGGDANWSTGANWSGGSAPGSTNSVLFNSTCVTNCSPTISGNINVKGVRMVSGYSGTITQASAVTITVGSNGWTQFAGNFVGSDTAITINGPLYLSGGNYTSTSNTLICSNYNNITMTSGITFTANSGTLQLNTYKTVSIDNSIRLYNVDASSGNNGPYMTIPTALNVDGSLTVGHTYSNGNYSGTFNVKKDVSYVGYGMGFTVNLVGTGTQNLTGSVAGYELTGLNIASSGTVNLNTTGTPYFYGNFSYTSGTVNFTNTTTGLVFDSAVNTINSGTLHFQNLDIKGHNGGTYSITGTTYVDGNLNFYTGSCSSCPSGVSGGNIVLLGNFIYNSYIGPIGATIDFNGTVQQTIFDIAGSGHSYGRFNVNNAAGVKLVTAIDNINYLNVVSGFVDMNGFDMGVTKPGPSGILTLNGNTITKNGGVLKFNGSTVGTGALYGGTVNP